MSAVASRAQTSRGRVVRTPKPLAPPTMFERAEAARAARALRAAIADPSTMGTRAVLHIDYTRQRSEWLETWDNLPGFLRVNGRGGRYRHACLPGWEYRQPEIRTEMIPDLVALAERGVRPCEGSGVA